MSSGIISKGARQLVDELQGGSLEASKVFETYRKRINELTKLNAFITSLEYEPQARKEGSLYGLPFAIKDNISTEGIRTTCASLMLKDYVPPYDATTVAKLKAAGVSILGKTNMDEFGMGSSGENSAFGPTRNPWDIERVPGGSSSGSAVAVSARLSPAALGTDTGGSIRAPASFTGTVGFKPSYGYVSRYGLIAYANSLEQIGVIARTVDDVALIFGVIRGKDRFDSTSTDAKPVSGNTGRLSSEGHFKGALLPQLSDLVSKDVRDAFDSSVAKLDSEGIEFTEERVEELELALKSYYVIACCEATTNLARYDGVRYGPAADPSRDWKSAISESRTMFGKEVKARIMLGSYMLSSGYYEEYYLKALYIRRNLKLRLLKLSESYDFIYTPTMPVLPWKIGEMIDDPLQVYLSDAFTVIANLTGAPAISIPIALKKGLPVGGQLQGRYGLDDRLLEMAATISSLLKFRGEPPI
ncbi:MAG: Asp-tRNA(Asn)/Glu-tRNA(Gln) amidotransferase subunit GatA [Thaumarchaeota archaeon]|nr:Asp-tRNA(Asn)/Glu-tRNA(Gln) amidotransferase subunit GatA [Nitrososphaerota archaeon]